MLVLTTVTSLVQAVLFPDTAQAQADRHRAGTFNMQGAPDRWQQGVYAAAKQVEVLALQEVPDAVPPDAELADGAHVKQRTTLAHGFTVERYRWVNCRPPLPGQLLRSPCIIYKVRTPKRQNRSLAIVVNQPTDSVEAVQVIPPQPVVAGGTVDNAAKPALGIKLADGTWFYSLHAQNRPSRTSQRNDVPNLISKISAAAGSSHWAAMGDFNRTPDSLESLLASDYPDAKLVRSGHFTYPVKGPKDEFDYMITSGVADNQYTGFRLTYLDASDHYPVGFWVSAAPDGHEFLCDPIDDILRARQAACVPPKNPAIVSLGDSYISGEAGRWAGNADTGVQGIGVGDRPRCRQLLQERGRVRPRPRHGLRPHLLRPGRQQVRPL
ncbi:endonuclease/exonuclease/phosphatase family protein [Streptomyces sp. NPDC094438]|uniref:endonuclease/exonuclease/phosphatase family protein n=1 Tax=Streptomyces sp. NPDC094438 TaxID=3366061 RepID=UPI0038044D93